MNVMLVNQPSTNNQNKIKDKNMSDQEWESCVYVLIHNRENVTAQISCPLEHHVQAMVACVHVRHENIHSKQLQQLSSLWLQTLMCIPFPPPRLKTQIRVGGEKSSSKNPNAV